MRENRGNFLCKTRTQKILEIKTPVIGVIFQHSRLNDQLISGTTQVALNKFAILPASSSNTQKPRSKQVTVKINRG